MFFSDKDKIILDLDLGEEMEMIDLCESFPDRLKHPLIEAYVYAKWSSLRLAYIVNFTCHYCFLIFFVGYDKIGNKKVYDQNHLFGLGPILKQKLKIWL